MLEGGLCLLDALINICQLPNLLGSLYKFENFCFLLGPFNKASSSSQILITNFSLWCFTQKLINSHRCVIICPKYINLSPSRNETQKKMFHSNLLLILLNILLDRRCWPTVEMAQRFLSCRWLGTFCWWLNLLRLRIDSNWLFQKQIQMKVLKKKHCFMYIEIFFFYFCVLVCCAVN